MLDPRIVNAIDQQNGEQQDALDALRAQFSTDSSLAWERDDLVLTIPIRAKFRGGQLHITAPGIGVVNSFAQPNRALVKAIVHAHAWLALLIDGGAKSVEDLARYVRRDRPYVRRVLRLAFLSPSITSLVLDGKQPGDISASELLAADLPYNWRQQMEFLGIY